MRNDLKGAGRAPEECVDGDVDAADVEDEAQEGHEAGLGAQVLVVDEEGPWALSQHEEI